MREGNPTIGNPEVHVPIILTYFHYLLYFFFRYGAKADVWSAGIITYILLSGVMPFNKKKKKKKAGLSLSYPKWYWENISSEARDFVQCLLKVSPSDRYTSSQLLQHSWFKVQNFGTDVLVDLKVFIFDAVYGFRSRFKVPLITSCLRC